LASVSESRIRNADQSSGEHFIQREKVRRHLEEDGTMQEDKQQQERAERETEREKQRETERNRETEKTI